MDHRSLWTRAIYEERAAQIGVHGYGMFAKYDTFMLRGSTLAPVKSPDRTELSELFGYEMQRREVLEIRQPF